MKICVIGTGYVGLVSGVCWAEMGHEVTCVDNDQNKIDSLRKGISPIYETGLEQLMAKNSHRIFYETNLAKVINATDLIVIAVGTPQAASGEADLSAVRSVAHSIAKTLLYPTLVVVKSTVPIGTCDEVENILRTRIPDAEVASNPEFLREGSAVKDFLYPDRVVCGITSDKTKQIFKSLYGSLPIIFMQRKSSEMTKYVANAMLACRISFMNEMAEMCEGLGANIEDVRRGIGSDKRIGSAFLAPGPGWGGSCFPKDVSALSFVAQKNGMSPQLLTGIGVSNMLHKRFIAAKIKNYFGDLKNKKLALWGLAFKPNTDDVRDSPAMDIISWLKTFSADLVLHDPIAMNNFKMTPQGTSANYAADPISSVLRADAIIILTEWDHYRNVDWAAIALQMNQKVIFDFRNMLDRATVESYGFTYFGLGI